MIRKEKIRSSRTRTASTLFYTKRSTRVVMKINGHRDKRSSELFKSILDVRVFDIVKRKRPIIKEKNNENANKTMIKI